MRCSHRCAARSVEMCGQRRWARSQTSCPRGEARGGLPCISLLPGSVAPQRRCWHSQQAGILPNPSASLHTREDACCACLLCAPTTYHNCKRIAVASRRFMACLFKWSSCAPCLSNDPKHPSCAACCISHTLTRAAPIPPTGSARARICCAPSRSAWPSRRRRPPRRRSGARRWTRAWRRSSATSRCVRAGGREGCGEGGREGGARTQAGAASRYSKSSGRVCVCAQI